MENNSPNEIIHLTQEQIDWAVKLAQHRNTPKVEAGVKSNITCNKKSLERFHTDGAIGEVVVHLKTGWPIDTEFYMDGDQGVDFEVNGKTIDVKYRDYLYPYADLPFNHLDDFKSDYAVLVVPVKKGDYSASRICGYISRDDFMNSYSMKNFGYGDRFIIGQDQLRSFDELTEVLNSMEVALT